MAKPGYHRLEIEFRKTSSGRRRSVFFLIESHSLAQRWAKMLEGLLRQNSVLEKNYLLHGWLGNGRDIPFLCGLLNEHIATINRYFKDQPAKSRYFIDLHFDPKTFSQNDLNLIHGHFEILLGSNEKKSKYLIQANDECRTAIRELNHICHELEQRQRAEEAARQNLCGGALIASFLPTKHVPLRKEDFEHFDLRLRFGQVRLHYAQIGKSHLEMYQDGDEITDRIVPHGLNTMTGEFDIHFSVEFDEAQQKKLKTGLRRWLVKNGFDPNEKELGIGFVPVANLDRSAFKKRSDFEILTELNRYDDVSKIALHSEEALIFEREYPKSLRQAQSLTSVLKNAMELVKKVRQTVKGAGFDRLEVEFRHISSGERRSVFFLIDQNQFAQRWASLLAQLLKKKAHLEKKLLMLGWLSTSRDLKFLCQSLNQHISIINQFFSQKRGKDFYSIDQKFDPRKITSDDLNRLHHHFEILIGQIWSPSKYYQIANPETCESIRELNNICHEIEVYLRAAEAVKQQSCKAHLVHSFAPVRRFKLRNGDYKHFDIHISFGEVTLHYAQLGKTHLEAFMDNDQEVGKNNINGLRYMTGEFDVSFNDGFNEEHLREVRETFPKWLKARGFNPKNKKLALGYATVARLDRREFPGKTNFQILTELGKFDDISKVALHSGSLVIEQTYLYSSADPQKSGPTDLRQLAQHAKVLGTAFARDLAKGALSRWRHR